MNTTKLRNAGNFALFVSWVLGIAIMVIGSTGHAGLSFLALIVAIGLSILLNSKYSSKVVKGIESLQKELNEANTSLTSYKSKAAEWESKYDKASSDLADSKAKAESLQKELDAVKASEAADESATADETTEKETAKSSKKKK